MLREEKATRRSMRNRNPFLNIFEMNGVSPNDIPAILNNNANIGFKNYAVRPKVQVKEEEEQSPSACYNTDPAQLDLIKERINLRRSMVPSAAKERLTTDTANSNSRPSFNALQNPYLAQQTSRRRSSDLLVGEVGDHLIQGQDEYAAQFAADDSRRSEDNRNTDKPQIREFWLHNQEEQPPRHNTYKPRSNATLGTYRRLTVERRGSGGAVENAIGRFSDIDRRGSGGTFESSRGRPQFRPPQID